VAAVSGCQSFYRCEVGYHPEAPKAVLFKKFPVSYSLHPRVAGAGDKTDDIEETAEKIRDELESFLRQNTESVKI
jgi:hypothetical protein